MLLSYITTSLWKFMFIYVLFLIHSMKGVRTDWFTEPERHVGRLTPGDDQTQSILVSAMRQSSRKADSGSCWPGAQLHLRALSWFSNLHSAHFHLHSPHLLLCSSARTFLRVCGFTFITMPFPLRVSIFLVKLLLYFFCLPVVFLHSVACTIFVSAVQLSILYIYISLPFLVLCLFLRKISVTIILYSFLFL